MTKCLSCGHFRHDLELNCPKCGSFYSKIADEFSTDDLKRCNTQTKIQTKIQAHFNHPKHRFIAIATVIFLVVAVMFL
jgi:uncharacterized membrane protein YvbJ